MYFCWSKIGCEFSTHPNKMTLGTTQSPALKVIDVK